MKQNSKKRIVPMLFALLVVLTLVSCCFLGSTFARYTSTSTGTVSVGIAKWDIDFDGQNDESTDATTVTFDKISPDDAVWAAGTDRTHETSTVLAATIVNKSDVAADITVSLGTTPVYNSTSGPITQWAQDGITAGGDAASWLEATSVIKIQFAADTTGSGTVAESAWKDYGESISFNDIRAIDGAVYVYVRVLWDTYDAAGQIASDALDTWFGENVASVSCEISYVAVQSSELPTA